MITAMVCASMTAWAAPPTDQPLPDSDQTQKVAEKLQSATVTVRIKRELTTDSKSGSSASGSLKVGARIDVSKTPPERAPESTELTEAVGGSEESATTKPAAAKATQITVCSGVSIGRGFVVTHDNVRESQTAAPDRYRITLPDGKQAKARLAVVDQFSQLHLLEVEDRALKSIPLLTRVPKVGSRIMSAAASGIDKPVVSIGMVGASDRTLPGVYLPPLIQCDIRTMATSTGSGIVDLSGRLVGVVTYTDPPEQRNGWTYAVPASQVARLMRAHVKGEVIVLRRRRPTVGMTLTVGKKDGVCVVERVTKGGPASRAGIEPGDIVHEAAGRKIRSPYQAVRQVLNRQPGDKLTMLVERNKSTKYVDVTLGGGGVVPVDSDGMSPMPLVPQNVQVKETPSGYEVTDNGDRTRIVPGARAPIQMSLDRVETLERQLAVYREEVERLRKQLRHRDITQAELQKLMTRMLTEIRELKKEQEASKKSR